MMRQFYGLQCDDQRRRQFRRRTEQKSAQATYACYHEEGRREIVQQDRLDYVMIWLKYHVLPSVRYFGGTMLRNRRGPQKEA